MFPMLAEDELHDLAEDIKAHGLLEPIVRDPDGVLLDGRNRLAACERAGVEPRFTTYEGTDQAEYIWLSNVRRRHISAGQRAMIQAMVLSRSGHSLRTHAKLHDVSRSRLSLANTVLQSAPDLAEQVRAGKLSLDAAAGIAREHKAQAAAAQAAFDHLRTHAPDLAARVTEGELALDAATRELGQRQAAVRRDQEHLTAIAERWDALRELARARQPPHPPGPRRPRLRPPRARHPPHRGRSRVLRGGTGRLTHPKPTQLTCCDVGLMSSAAAGNTTGRRDVVWCR